MNICINLKSLPESDISNQLNDNQLSIQKEAANLEKEVIRILSQRADIHIQ
jgi:hypothetical protein